MADEKFRKSMHDGRAGAAITVKVIPRASRNEVAGIQEDGTIKIRLAAAPVDGMANRELVDFLSEILDIAKSKIEIIGGLTGRNKLISILDLDPATVQKRILDKLSS